jgi:hypothetical protein
LRARVSLPQPRNCDSHKRAMVPEESQFVEDAARIAISGRWDAVNERIKELAANPRGPDSVWQVELFAGLAAQVFSEYLLLKRAYEEDDVRDVSVLAWRARNLLELSVWSVYCVKSRENARRFYEDAGRDVNGVYTAFKKWGEATKQDVQWFQLGASEQQHLSGRALAEGIQSVNGRYTEVRDAARAIEIEDHFSLLFKLLSKFAHPTAMQIMFPVDDVVKTIQRESFFSRGCLFFTGAFTAIEKQILSNVDQ